ncbi:MAG TPA: glutamate-1-semialdehyde-2,1-aminomutase [Phycisphaerales bacterium]|nr:glutamate-1-semialdehyde-2,1-aminomutase [Phycisphaerales bacterium]
MSEESNKSAAAFERARRVLVGGVNSPVRAFAAVGGTPPVIACAAGAKIVDLDGREYIDYVGSYGPAILGHAPPAVVRAIRDAAGRGSSYGAPTAAETLLAEAIAAVLPSVEKVRFTSSGTEAAMTAVRLARGATGRAKIVKFVGCYHGHADALLVSAGSGATTLGVPSSPGVPAGAVADTLLVEYNDLPGVERAFSQHGGDIAAVLVEPVAGNMGVVPPAAGFLESLRRMCDKHGTLLVFDEVMTGFRVSHAGAQGLYGVRPDLTVLGKIIGASMPVGAVGGPAAVMKHLAPEGPVYQAGTLSGNPVAMAAGLAALAALREKGFYDRLEKISAELEAGLRSAATQAGLAGKVTINRVGSMLTVFFAPPPVINYRQATASDTQAFAAYFHAMLEAGIYLPPSQFEAIFVSAAHTESDIAATVQAAHGALRAAARLMETGSSGR